MATTGERRRDEPNVTHTIYVVPLMHFLNTYSKVIIWVLLVKDHLSSEMTSL